MHLNNPFVAAVGGLHMHMVAAVDSRLAWKSEELMQTQDGLQEIADTLDSIVSAQIPGGMRFRYLEFDVDGEGLVDISKRLRDKRGWTFAELGSPLHAEAHVPARIIKAARIECEKRPPHLQFPKEFKLLLKKHPFQYKLEQDDDGNEVFLNAAEYLELQDLRFVVLAFHCHKCVDATCFKGGRTDCRFRFPFKLRSHTSVTVKQSESGASVKVDVDLKRNHAYVNTYNPSLACSLRGNHDLKFTAVRQMFAIL